ncbi:MAG: type II toxin-antitoxin system HicA family toxin [Defluviitaleaceae bacterium]|nr:type II toxin-antitoxin system HicA family toxin [Defluviitaleaceae bacterium]
MGSKYPVAKASEVVRALERLGFVFKSKSGSHAKYIKVSKNKPKRTVIVPMHADVPKGTLQSILEQADIPLDEFMLNL